MRGTRLGFTAGMILIASGAASPVSAHAFGARYDLPLPLWIFLVGAGATVALSFVVMAVFLRREAPRQNSGPRRLDTTALGALLLSRPVTGLVRALGVALFLLVVTTGLWGEQSATGNFAPTFVWVIFWVGLGFVQCLLGDLWRLLNPWATLFDWAAGLRARLISSPPRRPWAYPAWLGHWPAVALFWAFAWFELVPQAAERPMQLAQAILFYSALTWAGMWAFGKEVWLGRGELFTLVFGLFARFAPVVGTRVVAEPEPGPGAPKLRVRPYGVGLLTARPLPVSLVMMAVLLLSTVTFDGVTETPAWRSLLTFLLSDATLRPLLSGLQAAGVSLFDAIMTTALLLFPLAFLAIYRLFAALTALAAGHGAAGGGAGAREAAGGFVLTLIPIAIAYHLSHYLSYLLLAGQLIIPLLSDPYGLGWNLFGTRGHSMDISVITPKFVWYFAGLAVVVGHVYGVFLAHVMALRLYGSARRALRSQIPLLVLMVGYTMLSLWILSQPIVE